MPYSKSITQVWKCCAVCSADFLTKRSTQDRVMTCSRECGGKYRSAKSAVQLTCLNCKTLFSIAPYKRKNFDNAFCGVSCARSYGRVKVAKGWRVSNDGYVYANKNGRKIFQHRVVMEEFLGRPLRDKENVHHVNGVRSDNRIENLELWDHSQPKGQRLEDKLGAAKKLLEGHGYIVYAPFSDFASGVLFGAAPQVFN